MTSAERRRLMGLLYRAKNGEEYACEELTASVARHHWYMISGYHSIDPAFDRDDLRNQFQLGIWQAIPKVDERGDPLFHLAWRGQRAVCSLLKTIERRRRGTEAWIAERGERFFQGIPEGWDVPDPDPEIRPEHAVLDQVEKNEARQHVLYVLTRVSLTSRQHDVIGWMLTDEDINDIGANQRLAQKLGVSEQRASQYRTQTLTVLRGGLDDKPIFVCPDCGRELHSKGALTQHLNGQSGHRPCEARGDSA